MHEAGLLNHWQDIYQPKPYKCLEMSQQKDNDPRITAKITLKNFAVLFGMLLSGFFLSLIVLIFENWLAACKGPSNSRLLFLLLSNDL